MHNITAIIRMPHIPTYNSRNAENALEKEGRRVSDCPACSFDPNRIENL